jgi:hypothetical protein
MVCVFATAFLKYVAFSHTHGKRNYDIWIDIGRWRILDTYYRQERVITSDGEEVGASKIRKYYSPFQEGRGYNFKYKSTAIKSYLGIELPKCFTDNECGKVYRLSKRIYSDSNLLAKRVNNEIRPMTKQDIIEVVGVHRANFMPFWNKVLKNKIIKPVILGGEEYFCFNPLYYNTTTYMPLYLYIAFQDDLKKHIPEWVVQKYLDMKESQSEKPEEGSKSAV